MKCPNCGKNNYGNVERCFNCGTSLKPLQPQYSPQPYPVSIPPTGNVYPPQQAPRQPYRPQVSPVMPQQPVSTQPQSQPPQPQLKVPTVKPQVPGILPPPVGTPQVIPPPPPQPQAAPPPGGLPPNVVKPTSGVCSQCRSTNLQFFDNGLGKCPNCGRTFDWLNAQLSRLPKEELPTPGDLGIYSVEEESFIEEDNPFLATDDEKLSVSERKAEVDAEDIIYHDPSDSVISSNKKKKPIEEAEEKPTEDKLDDEKRLKMLEDRFLSGQISEDTYKKLREKYATKLLKTLEDKLVKGEITENEYNELKSDYE